MIAQRASEKAKGRGGVKIQPAFGSAVRTDAWSGEEPVFEAYGAEAQTAWVDWCSRTSLGCRLPSILSDNGPRQVLDTEVMRTIRISIRE